MSKKLNSTPRVFTVEKHIRSKLVCCKCERLVQAPIPAHIIDTQIPTAGLLAQVLLAEYLDHAPLYREDSIFGRAGLALSRSTLAEWVGACGKARISAYDRQIRTLAEASEPARRLMQVEAIGHQTATALVVTFRVRGPHIFKNGRGYAAGLGTHVLWVRRPLTQQRFECSGAHRRCIPKASRRWRKSGNTVDCYG